MLLGLAALPVLAAVYGFAAARGERSSPAWRSGPIRGRRGRAGGSSTACRHPLTLLLELLAIAALVVAAAGPAMVQQRPRPAAGGRAG